MPIVERLAKNQTLLEAWRRIVPENIRRTVYHARAKGDSGSSGLVSVVVPVYNVELYLDECVASIVKQSYKKLEIILVDDGATDSSGAMCEEWAKRDERIRVVHQKNAGLSAARNTGLSVASGEFVIFTDSDDTLPVRAFELLASQLKQSGSDIATGNVKRFKGEKFWDGWNQSYSHRKILYPELHGREAVTSVQLTEHPELLFDTTAWNKMFRRDFLLRERIQFPIGKLYEDMHPMAIAFSRAEGIDVIFSNVYNYRVRENATSITQKRSEVKNLAHKMEMVDKIYELTAQLENSEELRRTVEYKVFEGDLPVYSPYLGVDSEFDDIYFSSVEKYWDASDSGVLNRLALNKRAKLYWERRREVELSLRAKKWVDDNFFLIPTTVKNGLPFADLSGAPEYVRVLEDAGLNDMSRYLVIRSKATETCISHGRLSVVGFAFPDEVPESAVTARRFFLKSNGGHRIDIPSVQMESEWANDGWWNLAVDRSGSGFQIDVELAEVFGGAGVTDVELGSHSKWILNVEFDLGSRTVAGPVATVWRGGSIRLGGSVPISPKHAIHLDWSDWRAPLTLRAKSRELDISEVTFDGKKLRVLTEYHYPGSAHISKIVLKRSRDNFELYGSYCDGDELCTRYEFDLTGVPDRANAGGHSNTWKLLVLVRGRWIVAGVTSNPTVQDSSDREWDLRTDSSGHGLLVDPENAFLVRSIGFDAGIWTIRGSAPREIERDLNVLLWSDNKTSHQVPIEIDNGNFCISVDPTEAGHWGSPVSWKTGEYYFWLRSGRKDSRYRVRASRQLATQALPAERWTQDSYSRFHVSSDAFSMSLRVGPPVLHVERGRYNHTRMTEVWSRRDDDEVKPMEAVVFSSFMSRNASDSVLAIFEALRDRGVGYELIWAVDDGSISVPEGASKIVRRTEKWFEVLSTARMVVNNVGAIEGYGDRSFQKFVQTWHGTPFKLVGKSAEDYDGFNHYLENRRIEEEASSWDLFVAQNEFISEIARRDFGYTGKVLKSGSPRNDTLVTSEKSRREAVRTQLGLSQGTRAILYAPTWRESMSSGKSSRIVDFLDLDELTSQLGQDVSILLRGHNYNAAYSSANASRGAILDVTQYADINDLIIASDVLITDYSSIMFDYMLTDKPMIAYVPDAEEYLNVRGAYGELSEFTCGPIVEDFETLVNELELLDSWHERWAERVMQLRAKFLPWDDGNATSRVLTELGF